MTTVYIIRHAEAEGNVYRRCHGQYDSLLTPRAYEQLPCLAKRFENVPLDAVYASDLFRTRTTAKAVAEAHGLTVGIRPVLREIDMGDWEDVPWAELPRLWPEEYAVWRARPWDAVPPHGESVMQAGRRMLDGVRGLVRENEGKSIAVVTHGSAIRGALTIAHGFAPEQMGEIGWGDNTCVAKFEFDGPDKLEVVYENDASHLPQQLSTFASIGWTDNKGVPTTPQIWFRRADPMDTADADEIVSFMRELHRNAYGTDANLDPDALL
ncbi:MAG TPA: histidine phosphatase family protein, partial [Candidatus Agathobaculum intestinigallinarum]|nr:histidine phosphatase family protein [Candidatus Agathobaculum intestinigallinarum]